MSTACLHEAKDASKGSLQIKTEEGTFTLAILEKDKHDMATFDLFFNTMVPPTFFNNTKNEVHLTGYFEMNGEEDYIEDMEDSDVSDEEEEVPMKAITGLKKGSSKLPEPESEDESEDEEDDEDEELGSDMEGMSDLDSDDMEDDDEMDSEDDGEDSEEESDEEEEAPVAQAGSKRSVPATATKAVAAKVQKTTEGGNSTETYTKQIVAFLKTAGKTTVGMVGAKVKKPEDIKMKLKAFLMSRKEFQISGDNIELKA